MQLEITLKLRNDQRVYIELTGPDTQMKNALGSFLESLEAYELRQYEAETLKRRLDNESK